MAPGIGRSEGAEQRTLPKVVILHCRVASIPISLGRIMEAKMAGKSDDTVGQPRRASDSQPRPETGTPSLKEQAKREPAKPPRSADGELRPSSSWSPIDPGRPTK